MKQQPKNIIVVGAPRSGTSLTAAAFARNGYFVGEMATQNMRDGDDGNPFGYFEADEVINRNVEVFAAADYPYHNTWKFDEIGEESIRRIAAMPPLPGHRQFVQDYGRHAPWMWKDPRLCFTLGYWWKLMDPKCTGVVLVRREFVHIHNSFVRRNWCPEGDDARERLRLRLDRHLRAAEEAIGQLDIPHLEMDYAEYIRDPQTAARRLSEFCGTPFSVDSLNVRPELNHASGRGWLAGRVRRSLDQGWLRHAKFLRPFVPRRILTAILPERRFERTAKS